jgi:dTDP-4-dehydrorhamnose 3,5-epimerase
MKILPTNLPGVLLVELEVHADRRGHLIESWQQANYEAAGMNVPMVQDNFSYSTAGVLRGLHFQHPHGQAKLISVVQGEIYDVAVDVRRGSPTFGRWFAARLSQDNHRQLFIPSGYAHGFCVLGDAACVAYKCSDRYYSEAARTIAWNDPQLNIPWPITNPVLSEKDAAAPCLDAFPVDDLPSFGANGDA